MFSKNDNYYYTSDLGLCAALVCVGFELIDLNRDNPRKVGFVFEKKVGLDEVVKDYFSGKLKVSARMLFDNIKAVKNRLYSN